MNETMEYRFELLVKWLRVLMYIAIVSLVNSVVNFLPIVPASVTTWISRGIMVAVVVCMFQLTPANARYKKAGIMRAVMLVCTLITAFVYASSILKEISRLKPTILILRLPWSLLGRRSNSLPFITYPETTRPACVNTKI